MGSRGHSSVLLRAGESPDRRAMTRSEAITSLATGLAASCRLSARTPKTNPTITRGLDRATTFLSLVSLIALIVGALGVATAMHSHLQQKMDSIAIMKCLGARSTQIIRIYVSQTLALGLAGGLAGIALGLAVQGAFAVAEGDWFKAQVPKMGEAA